MHGYKKFCAYTLALAVVVALAVSGHGSTEAYAAVAAVVGVYVGGQAAHDRASVTAAGGQR